MAECGLIYRRGYVIRAFRDARSDHMERRQTVAAIGDTAYKKTDGYRIALSV